MAGVNVLITRKRIDALLRSAHAALEAADRAGALTVVRRDQISRLVDLVKKWSDASRRAHGAPTAPEGFEKEYEAAQRLADCQRFIDQVAAACEDDAAFLATWFADLESAADDIIEATAAPFHRGHSQHPNTHLEPSRHRIESLTRAPGAPPQLARYFNPREGSSMHAAA